MRPITTHTSCKQSGHKSVQNPLSASLSHKHTSVLDSETTKKTRSCNTDAPPKRGSFSLQSGSYQYGLLPLNSYTNSQSDFYTFPRRKMDSHMPIIMKTNGQATMNGYNGKTSNGLSGMSTPSTDSFHSSPTLSPKCNGFDLPLNGPDDASFCSSDTDSFIQERFYINENVELTPSQSSQTLSELGDDEHPYFTGMKDFRNPDTLQEMKIVSNKGTIRGVKNRVKGAIATILLQDGKPVKNYRALEKDKIVLYTTSMMIVRDTHENCKKVKNILHTHMVEYEERDIFMSKENQKELQERLGHGNIDVPQVFVDGQHFGGVDEVLCMNEIGKLRRIFKNFKKISHGSSCERCGGYRYIPCLVCHGSRKSLHRNHFTEEFCALRCIICDENGLVRCDTCNIDSVDSGQTRL